VLSSLLSPPFPSKESADTWKDLVSPNRHPPTQQTSSTFRDPHPSHPATLPVLFSHRGPQAIHRAQVVFDGPRPQIILGGPSFDLEVRVTLQYCSASMITRVHGKFSGHSSPVWNGSTSIQDFRTRVTLAPAQLFRPFSAVQSLYVSADMNRLVVFLP